MTISDIKSRAQQERARAVDCKRQLQVMRLEIHTLQKRLHNTRSPELSGILKGAQGVSSFYTDQKKIYDLRKRIGVLKERCRAYEEEIRYRDAEAQTLDLLAANAQHGDDSAAIAAQDSLVRSSLQYAT